MKNDRRPRREDDDHLSQVPRDVIDGVESLEATDWYRRLYQYLYRRAKLLLAGWPSLARTTSPTELAQQGVVKVRLTLANFRSRGAGRLHSWLNRLLRNQATDESRRPIVRHNHAPDGLSGLNDGEAGPVALAEQLEGAALLGAALEKLEKSDREILELRFYKGFTYEEIAEAVGGSTRSVRARFDTVLHKLRIDLRGLA
ncbi:MAG: sigma-70 family RNA polymerase sigma factor [Isosphaeraceae bacterium]